MRLATFNTYRLGALVDQDSRVLDLSDLLDHSSDESRMRQLIRRFAELQPTVLERIADRSGDMHELADVTLAAPVPDPSKIVAAPLNYRNHQREMKQAADVGALGFFLKSPSSLVGSGEEVRLPYLDRRFDHEAEFACIIGSLTHKVTPQEALSHVFGYVGLIDVTMRGTEDRSTRKSFDTFTPCGPWLVTADEFGPPTNVSFSLLNNGRPRQVGNTAELIWDVASFVSYASSVTTLLPGDVITTGTPAGVSPILAGDEVTLQVEGIGRLEVSVTADGAVECPTSGSELDFELPNARVP